MRHPRQRCWTWCGERLPPLLATRAESIRGAILAPLLSGLAAPLAAALDRDRTGWDGLLAGLSDGLDLESVLRLLDHAPPAARPDEIPEPAWQEALLGAASGYRSRFERECAAGCAALAGAALERARLPDPERHRLRALLPDGAISAEPPDLVAAIADGRPGAVATLLAGAAGVPAAAIGAAIAIGNRRGLVALAWQAGYGMRTAEKLQLLVAGIEPRHLLRADADGGCPLGRAELAWQIRFLRRGAGS